MAPDAKGPVSTSVSVLANKGGRPRLYDRGPDWREPYLDALVKCDAKQYLAAHAVGLAPGTIREEQMRSEEFALRVRDICEAHADRLEQDMEDQARSTGNPVGFIVRLKALRPAQYLERHLAMTISATTEIESKDGAALLAHAMGAMLASTHDQVAQLVAPRLDVTPRELEASKDASGSE